MRSMAILLPIVRRAASAGPPLPTRARGRLAQLREGLEVRHAARRQMLDAAPNRGFSSDVHGPIFLRLRLRPQRLWAGGTTPLVFTPPPVSPATGLLAGLVALVRRLRRATPSGGRDCPLGSVLRGIAQGGGADRPAGGGGAGRDA